MEEDIKQVSREELERLYLELDKQENELSDKYVKLQDKIDKAIDYIKNEISLIDKDLIECELTYDEKQYFEITRNKYVSVLEILGGD